MEEYERLSRCYAFTIVTRIRATGRYSTASVTPCAVLNDLALVLSSTFKVSRVLTAEIYIRTPEGLVRRKPCIFAGRLSPCAEKVGSLKRALAHDLQLQAYNYARIDNDCGTYRHTWFRWICNKRQSSSRVRPAEFIYGALKGQCM